MTENALNKISTGIEAPFFSLFFSLNLINGKDKHLNYRPPERTESATCEKLLSMEVANDDGISLKQAGWAGPRQSGGAWCRERVEISVEA